LKRKLLKFSALVLAITLVLTGCGSNTNNTGNSSTNSAGNENSTGNNGRTDTPDKVTFTYFNGVAGKKDINTNETTIGKILEDQTGVNFKLEFLVGDLNTKIGTMIASNEYPEVLTPDAAIDEVIGAGAFIDLTPYLTSDEYPNLKRVYEPYLERMQWSDGKIYTLSQSVIVNDFQPDPNINQGAFWVQRRVLKEAGYPKIKTLDEYFTLVEDFVKKHPEEDLTGFLSLSHDWRFFATSNPPMHLMGYPNDGEVIVDMDDYEAHVYTASEGEKRWLKKLNEINAKGLFDKSSYVDNYDQYIAKLTSHQVVGFFDYGWQFNNAQLNLRDAAKQDPSQDDFVYFPLPVTFDGQKDQYLDPPGFVNNRGVGVTVSAEDPDRIMSFFDTLLSEENQTMRAWGIEGETYEIDDNGRYYRTKEQVLKIDEAFREDFGFKHFDWDWPMYNTNSMLANGNALTPSLQPEVFQMDLTEGDKAILDAYGVKTYSEMFSPPDDRPWFPAWGIAKEQGSPEQIYETKKTELVKKFIPKLVLAKPADFEDAWADYEKEFAKLDTAGYEAFVTNGVKKLVELSK
jgi:putative aldouronate transport system substrate-binding protein